MAINIYNLLDELDNLIDEAWSLPLTGGKTVLDADKVREIVDDIRNSIPQEIRQARAMVSDRKQILEDARKEGEGLINTARERAKEAVSRDEIVLRAKAQANDILMETQKKSQEISKAANKYIDDLMKKTDDQLTANLAQFRQTRQNIKMSQKKP
eukprot:TRINITY_DN3079_c0_g3_i1.p1 TRINITY_DN3079_c0_g3~~TRINITY_DN3079_c0_g3_i1.p1  ORF type:complete len:155 (+),score=11.74 TRINITY_DN3079_c0_g3_i1:418-882(+)